MSAVTASTKAIMDKSINLALAAKSAVTAGVKAYAGDTIGAAEDAADAGEKVSEDTTSNKSSRSGDKMSTGKGGGGGGGAPDIDISSAGGGG
jgi:hypothetical protein